ncbi:SCP-like extracellular protein [Penicillium brasilianum]|uniref:SCP-like extracellular protein n=1 Tax=Penicillium brasilianum TaxID=104259 RepID=A0A1S9RAX4_PENBI|nr:SCP-like extracellular protein [Penicillium brasilianum]
MRSTLLLAALAAGCVNAFEKRVYVTDWTTVTVTKTITAAAVTVTVQPAAQAQIQNTVTTTTQAPVVAATTESESSELAKKSTVIVPVSSTTEAAAAAVDTASAATSYFSTAWTSTVEASSTLSSSTSSASTAASTASATNSYQSAVLYNHNIHRSNHSVSSVEWSADLEASAQTLAARCVYEHDTTIDGGGYGQNIGYGVSSDEVGVMITNLMYNDEIEYFPTPYGASDPSMTDFDKWGHFSQIVWKATTHVGCATVTCNSLGNVDSGSALPFTVCNYSPAGNVGGEYGDNVLAPGTASTYTA